MQIVSEKISIQNIRKLATQTFGDMVKGVVDVERAVIAIDADLHADLEALLLEDGSRQEDLWGINFYPDIPENEFVEFDSLINIRPSQGNRSRTVEDARIRMKILAVVSERIAR